MRANDPTASTLVAPPVEAAMFYTGWGRRLGPAVRSKALIPFLGRPLVQTQLERLSDWGVQKVTLLARPTFPFEELHDLVRDAPVPCDAAHVEDWPEVHGWLAAWAETAAATMVTINGDLLLDGSWRSVIDGHHETGADLTVVSVRFGGGDGQYGKPRPFSLDAEGNAVRASDRTVLAHEIGMTVSSPRALRRLAGLPHQEEDPWADEFIPRLIDEGHRVRVAFGDGYWRDLGTWRRIWAAHGDQQPQYIGPSAEVDSAARLAGWFWIGPDAVVAAGAEVENSVVGGEAVIGRGVRVRSSFVGTGVRLDADLTERVVNRGHAPEAMTESLGT